MLLFSKRAGRRFAKKRRPAGNGLLKNARRLGGERQHDVFAGVEIEQCVGVERVATQVTHELQGGLHAWLQVLRGNVSLNGEPLRTSDGAAVSDESQLKIEASDDAEVMLFDLA